MQKRDNALSWCMVSQKPRQIFSGNDKVNERDMMNWGGVWATWGTLGNSDFPLATLGWYRQLGYYNQLLFDLISNL